MGMIKFDYHQETKDISLHTLDSKFIKMADLVDCLARSSSFCSTAKKPWKAFQQPVIEWMLRQIASNCRNKEQLTLSRSCNSNKLLDSNIKGRWYKIRTLSSETLVSSRLVQGWGKRVERLHTQQYRTISYAMKTFKCRSLWPSNQDN